MSDLFLAFEPEDTLCLWLVQPGDKTDRQPTVEQQRRTMIKALNDLIDVNGASLTAWQKKVDDNTEQIYLHYDYASETFHVDTRLHTAVLFRLKPLTIFSVKPDIDVHQLNPESWFAWGETIDMASVGKRLDTSSTNPPNLFFQSLSGQPLLSPAKSLFTAHDNMTVQRSTIEGRVELALESKGIANPRYHAVRWAAAALYPTQFRTNTHKERAVFSHE